MSFFAGASYSLFLPQPLMQYQTQHSPGESYFQHHSCETPTSAHEKLCHSTLCVWIANPWSLKLSVIVTILFPVVVDGGCFLLAVLRPHTGNMSVQSPSSPRGSSSSVINVIYVFM